LIGLLAALLLATGAGLVAQAATTERLVVNRYTGLAISGFDPVAYFTDREAKVGEAEFEATEGGAVWRFCNSQNRAFFLARPDIYAPQFGGYDPLDVARGVAVPSDSRLFVVSGQRLYLFAREDSRDAFAADPELVLRDARRQWPELLAMLAE
jgi:YHS domain-containing protein